MRLYLSTLFLEKKFFFGNKKKPVLIGFFGINKNGYPTASDQGKGNPRPFGPPPSKEGGFPSPRFL